MTWDGGGDGRSWADPLNWDADVLPVAGDDAVIPDLTGSPEIYFDQSAGSQSIRSLQSAERLWLRGGSLTIEDTWVLLKEGRLDGGRLNGGRIESANESMLVIDARGDGSTLDGVQLAADALFRPFSGTLQVSNGLTLTGGSLLDVGIGSIRFQGAGQQVLGGDGTVVFDNGWMGPGAGAALLIDSGITIANRDRAGSVLGGGHHQPRHIQH